ncbi:hypothetical protein [Paraburkholderia fynbosensis]|uniref:Uncharacterized protein n=1 Tax=Paraburkholderia fynbosensis TaxID=1200993 RepID=A0A6J5FIZ3_9BURK|nr:hypothetical protein [Paraburkholderia fynbosensis]CAB3780797.1 hypothetical protein LMG27177_01001 [Paraburkholderia fynbosensis]
METTTVYPHTFICDGDVRKFAPGYDIAYLSPERPTWPADIGDGPLPVYCYNTGDLVLCPLLLTRHEPARTIGVDCEACGIVCDDCNTVYATSRLLSLESLEEDHFREVLHG